MQLINFTVGGQEGGFETRHWSLPIGVVHLQKHQMVEVKKYSELTERIKEKLNSFIEGEFGHIAIVKGTEWATPDWTIIQYENDLIATFYNIVIREIIIDGETFRISGINNVITPKEFRGKGYASNILRETEHLIFDDLSCKMGVLLCADDLIPFYERLNWYRVYCPVYFRQSTGQKIWAANTMLLTINKKSHPAIIDLNGVPW